ncbi:hypothetical protein [Arthrobacter sp. B10-11]|uniref:hypothetical protein n=1 Tax=Arthrobacter sp. B10-11 TaxID=3081160 RepID=UPI002952C052|nr:hypothetical protein [Arthrobacter sp. B10-11]MDV8148941.1 hypothetical protein [Arthrobacter sp. B10-11]
MTTSDFYSDRANGPIPRTHDVLPKATAEGLFSLFRSKAQAHWLAQHFPEHCVDGNAISGTDQSALWSNVRAVIPELKEDSLFGVREQQSDDVLFDLMEYAAARIAKPVQGRWHEYMKHFELDFAEALGKREFRQEVNQILQRGGTMYELGPGGRIVRIGTTEVQQIIQQMVPASGDATLDGLLQLAKGLYISRKDDDRVLALDKLWDAFERLKTIDVSGNKKQSSNVLLDNITSAEFREVARAEMVALTALGNQFMIRHHETDKHPVPEVAQDYLFARMGSLIVFLLKVSNRLS